MDRLLSLLIESYIHVGRQIQYNSNAGKPTIMTEVFVVFLSLSTSKNSRLIKTRSLPSVLSQFIVHYSHHHSMVNSLATDSVFKQTAKTLISVQNVALVTGARGIVVG
jgi:hypothetical protein